MSTYLELATPRSHCTPVTTVYFTNAWGYQHNLLLLKRRNFSYINRKKLSPTFSVETSQCFCPIYGFDFQLRCWEERTRIVGTRPQKITTFSNALTCWPMTFHLLPFTLKCCVAIAHASENWRSFYCVWFSTWSKPLRKWSISEMLRTNVQK